MDMKALNACLISPLLIYLSLSICQSAMASPDGGCAFDRPCVFGHQEGNNIIFDLTRSKDNWGFFNVRYATRGGERQAQNRSGMFTFKNVQPNRVYTIKVQGCNSHTFGRSTCSPWIETSITTR
jgi:hypothetical protein